jgi:hypothetical protein
MDVLGPKKDVGDEPEYGEQPDGICGYPRRNTVHPCEDCKCCSCMHVCTMCSRNCCPSDGYFVPVIACPDFIPMQDTPPVRYVYRTGCDFEFKLHLPGSR